MQGRMDEGSLVKVLHNARSVNSQLMKTNLGLLISIRETDCEIQRAKEQLQKYQSELQRRGIKSDVGIQPKAPMKQQTDEQTPASQTTAVDEDDDDQNTDSSSDSSSNE
ncbi:hypothetical protein AeMF1_017027 [Aphanomyces euteiches]|nr:hypothetical protein AeMF1_017027 [Aphanomyces euteiches]KAH9193498.1 hypothetical protein AeNC1_004530 [Aphanomyces euteiches]